MLTTRQIAICSLASALLIAVQLALGFVPGVELVTAVFLAFCYTFGRRCGVVTATAFSLLRCLVFGFYPSVVALYLIYYNLFALLFGWLGERDKPLPPWLAPAILLLLAAASAALACLRLPVSILWQGRLSALLWTMCALFAALFALNCALLWKNKGKDYRETAELTALAAVCTVCFTLLDDVLTPLFYRLSAEAALAWFYTSFTAMIPQTICCVVSVSVLFLPLRKSMEFAAKKR